MEHASAPWAPAGCSGSGRGLEVLPWVDEFATFNERKARITELHYFGGLTQDEIAAVCDVHVTTVARDLRLSEAWLRSRIRAQT